MQHGLRPTLDGPDDESRHEDRGSRSPGFSEQLAFTQEGASPAVTKMPHDLRTPPTPKTAHRKAWGIKGFIKHSLSSMASSNPEDTGMFSSVRNLMQSSAQRLASVIRCENPRPPSHIQSGAKPELEPKSRDIEEKNPSRRVAWVCLSAAYFFYGAFSSFLFSW